MPEIDNDYKAHINNSTVAYGAMQALNRVNSLSTPETPAENTSISIPQELAEEVLPAKKESKLWSAAKDIALGGVEVASGRVPANALTGAISEAMDLAYQAGGLALKIPDIVAGTKLSEDKKIFFPEIQDWQPFAQPQSKTGAMSQSALKFLAGFAGAGKITGSLKGISAIGKAAKAAPKAIEIGEAALKGIISDMSVFDGHEERLSNLVQEIPALQNPISNYLAAKKEDSQLEGRLKNAIEGLGLGVLSEGIFKGVRAIKKSRAAMEFFNPKTEQKVLASIGQGVIKTEEEIKKGLSVMGNPADKNLVKIQPDEAVKGQSKTFINFSRIDTEEDVQKVMQDISDVYKQSIDKARRGKQTFKEIELNADQQDAWKVLLSRRTGQPLNAEQSVAVRRLWASSGEKLTEVANLAAANPTNENLFAFRKMVDIHNLVQQQVIAARTETARALASWRIPTGSAEEMTSYMGQLLKEGANREDTVNFAASIAKMGKERQFTAMDRMIEFSNKPDFWDMILEYRTAALLTSPKTHIINIIGNIGTQIWDITDRLVAERISAWTGIDNGVAMGEAWAQFKGSIGAFGDALRLAKKNWQEGVSKFGPEKTEVQRNAIRSGAVLGFSNKIFGKTLGIEIAKDTALGKAVDFTGFLVQTPFRALSASDEFFKEVAYRGEMRAQALRQTEREISSGAISREMKQVRMQELIDTPTPDIKIEAMGKAQYLTFTNAPNALAKNMQILSYKFPAMRFFVPFVRTPANIWDFTFKHSPLAPLYRDVQSDIAAGGARQATALAKIATGSYSLALFADLANQGIITGAGPEKASERNALLATGWQPYSIKLGDKYFSYKRFDPLATTLGMAADFVDISKAAEEDEEAQKEIDEIAIKMVFTTGYSLLNTNFMIGVSDLAEAINDPLRYGDQLISNLATSFVPTGVKDINKISNNYMRETSNALEKVKANIPGISKDLPLKYDIFGRKMPAVSGYGAAYDLLVPVRINPREAEPIDLEIVKQQTYIANPSSKLNYDGIEVSLKNKPEVFARYKQLAGNELKLPQYEDMGCKDFLNSILTGNSFYSELYSRYTNGADGQKSDFIKSIITEYRKAAREKLLEEYPDIAYDLEMKKEEKRQAEFEAATNL